MPLKLIDEPGWDDFRTDNIYFYMEDEAGKRVRCAVTRAALMLLSRTPSRTGLERIEAFKAHRKRLQTIASAKFDRGSINPADSTVYLLQGDIGHLG
jgi:hypothetical protein